MDTVTDLDLKKARAGLAQTVTSLDDVLEDGDPDLPMPTRRNLNAIREKAITLLHEFDRSLP